MYKRWFLLLLLLVVSGCAPKRTNLLEKTGPTTIPSDLKDNYICLSCMAQQLSWDPLLMSASLQVRGRKIKVILGSPWVKIDTSHVKLPFPARFSNGEIYVSKAILSYIKNIGIIRGGTEIKVMLDPGHGGKDPGAVGNGLREKDIVLDVAKRLARQLKASGIKVYMTRDTDRFVSLKKRARLANKCLPDVFVSIHANSSKNHAAKGIEVYYISERINDTNRAVVSKENSVLRFESKGKPDSELEIILWDMIHTENRAESLRLARNVARNISLIMNSPNRGAKGGPFYVLKWVNVPAVLIEIGFLSNPSEARKLSNPNYRERIARAIFKGLLSYFEEIKRLKIKR